MRIIAGTARSLPLKTIPGLATRPTTDKIKETLFNMMQADIPGCQFLDLFAGSGQIGLEALSRGAKCAVFVDNSRAAVSCIKENIAFTKFTDRSRVIQADARSALLQLEGHMKFDIIFMDPPYNQGYEKGVLESLSRSSLLAEDGFIVVEASQETEFSYLELMGYEIIKVKNYRSNCHVYIRKREAS